MDGEVWVLVDFVCVIRIAKVGRREEDCWRMVVDRSSMDEGLGFICREGRGGKEKEWVWEDEVSDGGVEGGRGGRRWWRWRRRSLAMVEVKEEVSEGRRRD